MNRASADTELDFDNAEPADPIPTTSLLTSKDTAPQSTNESPPVVPKKDISNGMGKKRKRSSKDEGRNDKKSRFQKPLTSRFPKVKVSAMADNGNRLQDSDPVATEALPGRDALKGFHDVSTSTRPQVQPFVLPLTTKDESPWNTYNKEYTIELAGLVTVAERKHPAHGPVIVKGFSSHNAETKLSRLRQIPENIQSSYFVSCIEVFNFQNILHIINEYMTLSLLQLVAAPRYPRENQVAAIIGQILGGIEYLESHNLVHGDITYSKVLLTQEGIVKIANQECCRTASPEDQRDHPDSQALGDIVMQLMEKRNRRNGTVGVDELHRWSRTVAGFLSDTTSAPAK